MASSFRFVGAFGGASLITLFVGPLVKYLGGANEAGKINYVVGFRWTMAIFAVASVVLFWLSFATTKERVLPPPQQKTNVREELGELVHNWAVAHALISSVLATTYFCLRGGTTLYYYKYVVRETTARPIFSWPGSQHGFSHLRFAVPDAGHGLHRRGGAQD